MQQNTMPISSVVLEQFQIYWVPNNAVTKEEARCFVEGFHLSLYQVIAEASWTTVSFWSVMT